MSPCFEKRSLAIFGGLAGGRDCYYGRSYWRNGSLSTIEALMDLALVRTEFRVDGIFSELRNAGGEMLFVTLEHAYQDALNAFVPKIPDGVYTCKRRISPRFGFELFEVLNVPDCTDIEIHPGNYNKDSSGCILVGLNITQSGGFQMIAQSKVAFSNLMVMQNGVDSFNLTVTST